MTPLLEQLGAGKAHGFDKLELPECGAEVVAHLWRPDARIFAALYYVGELAPDVAVRQIVACLGDEHGRSFVSWDKDGALVLDPAALAVVSELDPPIFAKLSRAVTPMFFGKKKEVIKGES